MGNSYFSRWQHLLLSLLRQLNRVTKSSAVRYQRYQTITTAQRITMTLCLLFENAAETKFNTHPVMYKLFPTTASTKTSVVASTKGDVKRKKFNNNKKRMA